MAQRESPVPTRLAWLWTETRNADVRLHLSTDVTASAAPDNSFAPSFIKWARALGCGLRTVGCGLRAVGCSVRATGCGMWAVVSGLWAAGMGLWAAGYGLEAAGYGLHLILADGRKSFLLHSVVLASASPYFKARCLSSNAEGRLQYADFQRFSVFGFSAKSPNGKDAVASLAGPLLLVEHMEEEELPAMEAVLRHCYTEELVDSGSDASELSVATLIQILALADI